MKKILLSLAISLMIVSPAFCQKYLTKSGHIGFFGKTDLMNIEANSNQATSIIDAATGDIVFKVLQTSFQFKEALMQEHYNEKYVESEKYPDALFKGKITNLAEVNFKQDGTYKAKVTGDLSLHGVTKNVSVDGTITVKDGKVNAQAKFPVTEKDFKIEVPGAVRNKIAETMDVTVEMSYSAMNK